MPYIKQSARESLAGGAAPLGPGDLNYLISTMVNEYIKGAGGLSYAAINEVVGVLECAKLELYRHIAGPYENMKILQNGDVYDIQA